MFEKKEEIETRRYSEFTLLLLMFINRVLNCVDNSASDAILYCVTRCYPPLNNNMPGIHIAPSYN